MRAKRTAVLAAAGLALLVSGCSAAGRTSYKAPSQSQPTGSPTAADLQAVETAVAHTIALTTAVSYQLDGARVFGRTAVSVTGSGEFDLQHASGELSVLQPAGRQRVVITPTVVYTQVPAGGAAALPAGKTWISADITGAESVGTNFPQFDIQIEGFNPLLYLDEIAWGAVSAAPLRPAHAGGGGGGEASGYLVNVDLVKALRRATGPAAVSISLAIHSELASLGSNTVVSVRIWVDASGRAVILQASPPGGGVGVATITMPQCCVAVAVAKPPLAKVVDLAQMTPSGERENNGGGDADGA